MTKQGMRIASLTVLVAARIVASSVAVADEEPKQWEQLFFPFPIVGAPPQLEQQVQVFDSYFRGRKGSGDVPSVELAYIASPHLGLVATVPFQVGFGGQTTGFEDGQLLVQWLAGNLTPLLPVVHGSSTRQILGTGLVSVMLTPQHFSVPV
jgi:hypothetical protein